MLFDNSIYWTQNFATCSSRGLVRFFERHRIKPSMSYLPREEPERHQRVMPSRCDTVRYDRSQLLRPIVTESAPTTPSNVTKCFSTQYKFSLSRRVRVRTGNPSHFAPMRTQTFYNRNTYERTTAKQSHLAYPRLARLCFLPSFLENPICALSICVFRFTFMRRWCSLCWSDLRRTVPPPLRV